MDNVLSSPFGYATLAALVVFQVCSLLVLALVSYEYRHVIRTRAQLFSVMEVSGTAKKSKQHRLLLLSYIVVILLTCLAIDLLFFFRPHLL